MRTIRRRLTVWYTVALGARRCLRGRLYLERRQSSLRELDQRLGLEADLANRWLSGPTSVLGRLVDAGQRAARARSRHQRLLRELPRLPGRRRHRRQVALPLGAARNLDRRRPRALLAEPPTPCARPSTSATLDLGPGSGRCATWRCRLDGAGPEVGGAARGDPRPNQVTFGPAECSLHAADRARSCCCARRCSATGWPGALRPVQGIMDEVEAITDGRSLHRRLAVPLSGDEMARLALTRERHVRPAGESFAACTASPPTRATSSRRRSWCSAPASSARSHPGAPREMLQRSTSRWSRSTEMTEMVDSLLTLARADEGRAPLAVEECDLRDLVADVAETAGMLGEGRRRHGHERDSGAAGAAGGGPASGSASCCSTSSPTPSSTRRRAARSTSSLPRRTAR